MLALVPYDVTLTVTGCQGKWFQVDYLGLRGGSARLTWRRTALASCNQGLAPPGMMPDGVTFFTVNYPPYRTEKRRLPYGALVEGGFAVS